MALFPGLIQSGESPDNAPHLEETVNESSFPLCPSLDGCLLGLCVVSYRKHSRGSPSQSFQKGEPRKLKESFFSLHLRKHVANNVPTEKPKNKPRGTAGRYFAKLHLPASCSRLALGAEEATQRRILRHVLGLRRVWWWISTIFHRGGSRSPHCRSCAQSHVGSVLHLLVSTTELQVKLPQICPCFQPWLSAMAFSPWFLAFT